MPRTSILDTRHRERAALRRFLNLAWHARYHARTALEAAQVVALCHAVTDGEVALTDAHAALEDLRRAQTRIAA